jgi:hypothetical protein
MHYTYYASDILEAAMELAQSKALNSYSFRDCMNWMTELWQNCYERIAQVDEGYYSKTIQLKKTLTTLPPFVRNTVRVYAARDIGGRPDELPNRFPYREASMTDLNATNVYRISGMDIYCADVGRSGRIIWLEYTPEPPFITYTKNNRDPKILEEPPEPPATPNTRYGSWTLSGNGSTASPYRFTSMHDSTNVVYVQDLLVREKHTILAMFLDYPYIFITYEEDDTGDWSSWILKDAIKCPSWIRFNPFDYQGRPSHVKYLQVKWNDYTGMGCVIEDQDAPEKYKYKELGWTPDTIMWYPSPIMRNYMVAYMARKFADLNGAQIQAIENEIASVNYQIANFLARDKSAWFRFDRVLGPTLGDIL